MENVLTALLTAMLTLENVPGGFNAKTWAVVFAVLLAIVFIAHITLVVSHNKIHAPLPQLIVDYNDQAVELEDKKQELLRQTTSARDLWVAVRTATACQLLIDQLRLKGADRDETLRSVLNTWVQVREQLFRYSEGSEYYNFGIYLTSGGVLTKTCQIHGAKIVPSNPPRTWAPGVGHVGMCFAQRRPLFSGDATKEDLLYTGNEDDGKVYCSMASAPIWVRGDVVGVLIITSNTAGQLVRDVHSPITGLMAAVLSQALYPYLSSGSGHDA